MISQTLTCFRWRPIFGAICLILLTSLPNASSESIKSRPSRKSFNLHSTPYNYTPNQNKQVKDVNLSHHPFENKIEKHLSSSNIHETLQSLRGGEGMFYSNNLLGAAFFVAYDIALRKVFTANDIAFPSMMAGCVFIFIGLVLAEIIKTGLGESIFQLLTPGSVLLAKWLSVFFVPGLAMLPLAPKFGSNLEVVKVLSVVVIGFFFTLFTSGFSVLSLRKLQGSLKIAPSSTSSITEASKGPPPKVFPDGVYHNVVKGAVLFGIVSTYLTRTSHSLAVPIQTLFMACTTIGSYIFGTRLPKSITSVIHPLVTSTAFTLLVTNLSGKATGQTFEDVLRTYKSGSLSVMKGGAGDFLLFLLGPCVVSLSIAMYSRKDLMKDNLLVVGLSTLVSAVGGLFGTAAFVRLINVANAVVRRSVIPRNVTTALAMAISTMLEGNTAITASVVVMTGIFGATFGSRVLTAVGINDPVTRGLAIGNASFGLGMASILHEVDAFPFAAIAMILTAVCATTLASIPAVKSALINIAIGE